MSNLSMTVMDSQVHDFGQMAFEARFPAFTWKAVALDMMGLPVGSRPTIRQLLENRVHATTMWMELTMRFDQMTTVQWAEHLENEEERVHNALIYLGRTSDKVSERLALMGVVGKDSEMCDCPLVHYLNGIYGSWFTKVFRADSYVDFVKVNNPHSIQQFVHEFDDGLRANLDMFADYPDIP